MKARKQNPVSNISIMLGPQRCDPHFREFATAYKPADPCEGLHVHGSVEYMIPTVISFDREHYVKVILVPTVL